MAEAPNDAAFDRPRASGAAVWRAPAEGFWWHLGWLGAVVLGALLLGAGSRDLAPAAAWGLGAIALAAAAGAVLSRLAADAAETVTILNWALCATLAAALTGGVAGPLSVWHLAPMAAGAAMGRIDRLALGGAASVGAAGLTALLGLGLGPAPISPGGAYGLGVFAVMTTAIGLGAALVLLQRRVLADQQRLAQSEARLRELVQLQPHLLVSVAADGRVLQAFGEAPAGVDATPGGSLQALAAEEHRPAIEAALRQAAADSAADVAFPADKDGQRLALSLRRATSSRLVGMLRDVTAQTRREADLEQGRLEAEQQNAGKSRFLANMSHELRTPLNAIMGFSDIMRQRLFGALSDRYADYAGLIHESGSHLLDLINDVLDMSKIEAERFELSLEEFDARDAVSGVLRLMRGQADRAGVQLRGVLPKEPLILVADRRALKQIALNLISNALKFTPRGGSVTVTVQGEGANLELIVADTGAGIGPEDLARLGRPYEQAGGAEQRAAGTGLGLSLVRSFAELHRGSLELESRLGEGTTATVRLPLTQPLVDAP